MSQSIPQILKENADSLLGRPVGAVKNTWFAWDRRNQSWCEFWEKEDGTLSFNGWVRDSFIEMLFLKFEWQFQAVEPKEDLLPIIENE